MKLIGVGFGRTGTMSLKGALEQLGRTTFHMIDLIMGENKERDLPYWKKIADGEHVDWHEVFDGWEATVDWPAGSRWRESCRRLPGRPGAAQLPRLRRLLQELREHDPGGQAGRDGRRAAAGREPRAPSPVLWGVIEKLIWQGDFQGRFKDKEWTRQMYWDRIETIKKTVDPDRLIVWELGVDGWEPICEKLGVPVPDKPFPHLHDTNEFRAEFGLQPLPA